MSPNLPFWHRRIDSMIEWDCLCSPKLIKGNRVSGCWQADTMWWRTPWMNMPSPWLPGEHCALCWWERQAHRSRFQQKQEVRIGGFLLPGPFFPPGPTQSQTQTMCVLTLWTSAYNQPGWLVGKCCGLLNNMWSQETFSPSLLPLLFESPLCVTLLGSLGGSGKRFLTVSGLQRHTPPSRFHSRLGTRWMWLGKYSSLSPGPKVISWYSSCHGLTRSRLRKMA